MKRDERGQVTAEVAVLFAFVIAGFLAMGFYLQRSTQGSVKSNTDSLGTQYSVNTGGYNSRSVSRSSERVNALGRAEVLTESCSQASHAVGTGTPTDFAAQAACDDAGVIGAANLIDGKADGQFGILPGSN